MFDVKVSTVFDEVLEFLTSTPTPEQIIAFRPSEPMQQRAEYLLEMNRNDTLSTEEREELEQFSRLEHFMRMLKIKAHKKLNDPHP